MSMHLIQALYDRRTPLPNDLTFYTQVLENKDFVAIAPQVYFSLKQQERLKEIPDFFLKHLREHFNQALVQNFFILNQLNCLLQQFENIGIDVIPLKGVRFAKEYFGHIGARPTSDIDLLIRIQDLEKGIACVKALGFTIEAEQIPGHFHLSFSKQLPESGKFLTVELHWDILMEKTADFDINAFWRQSAPVKQSAHIKKLSDYHTFYMICLHGWRHNLQSLKYFMDIMQMIHLAQGNIDFAALLRDAADDKTSKRIVRTLSIVYREFPFLDKVRRFPYKRSNLYWEYDSVRKMNGRSLKGYMDFIDYQFLSYDSVGHSLTEFVHWMKSDMISAVRTK